MKLLPKLNAVYSHVQFTLEVALLKEILSQ